MQALFHLAQREPKEREYIENRRSAKYIYIKSINQISITVVHQTWYVTVSISKNKVNPSPQGYIAQYLGTQ